MNEILKHLKERYPSTNFEAKKDEYFSEILFDNDSLTDSNEFYEYVYKLADRFLLEEEIVKFAICYDYLDEMESKLRLG